MLKVTSVCALQLMTAIETNTKTASCRQNSKLAAVSGILTDTNNFLFMRLTPEVDPVDPTVITNIIFEHTTRLNLFNSEGLSLVPSQSLTIAKLLCSLLLPDGALWSAQVSLQPTSLTSFACEFL